jgi:hypothetical protein
MLKTAMAAGVVAEPCLSSSIAGALVISIFKF